MNIGTELAIKLARIRNLLIEQGSDGLLLTSLANFSWLTGGRGHIGLAAEQACGKLLVTQTGCHLIVNNIEAERLVSEELLFDGIEAELFPWHAPEREQEIISRIMQGGRLAEEKQLSSEISKLRWQLTPEEMDRYREAGRLVANALEAACFAIKQGETELQIAARLAANCLAAGIDPVLQLVAVDGRTQLYRHPLPTEAKLDRYAMVVVGGRKNGLVVSATRCVHLGPPPESLQNKHRHVASIDASLIAGTRPGARVNELFVQLQNQYKELGYENEWTFHHQGGPTGYLSREYRASEKSAETVGVHQAFAWNPTIRGTKSEDTILVGEHANEILTETGNWPLLEFTVESAIIKRPDILVIQNEGE